MNYLEDFDPFIERLRLDHQGAIAFTQLKNFLIGELKEARFDRRSGFDNASLSAQEPANVGQWLSANDVQKILEFFSPSKYPAYQKERDWPYGIVEDNCLWQSKDLLSALQRIFLQLSNKTLAETRSYWLQFCAIQEIPTGRVYSEDDWHDLQNLIRKKCEEMENS